MSLGDDNKNLFELAFIDESAPYEVDQAGIYLNKVTKKFHLRTATGCSCWDGEYDEEIYDSLEEVERALCGNRTYNPSLRGSTALVEEARQNIGQFVIQRMNEMLVQSEKRRGQFEEQFVRYSARDCLADAARFLDLNPTCIVEQIRFVDDGNNPVLIITGRKG